MTKERMFDDEVQFYPVGELPKNALINGILKNGVIAATVAAQV